MRNTPDSLGRFERLARQAATRREAEAVAERERARIEEERRERERAEQDRAAMQSPEYLAGPSDGCSACYEWRLNWPSAVYAGRRVWSWQHGAAVNPEMRPWPADDPDPHSVEHCTHACHGPEGYALPIIAYA